MRVLVTLQAFAVERVQHAIVMGLFVAIATVRHRRMLGLMTVGAV